MVENGSDPVYKFYAEEATKLGLTAGYYFTHQDSGHVQGLSAAAATSVYTWPYIDGVMKERFADKNVAAVAMSKAVRPKPVSTETVGLFPPPMQLGMTALAAAASGPFYKDDPVLAGTRLKPDFVYKLPSSDGTLKRMAQTYNAIGGLVETFARRLDIDPVAVLAVWYVESGGRLFTPGRPVLNSRTTYSSSTGAWITRRCSTSISSSAAMPAFLGPNPRTTDSATRRPRHGARFISTVRIANTRCSRLPRV